MSQLEAILKQYEQASKRNTETNFNEKNYFTTYLEKGKKKATKEVRILPAMDGQATPFVEIWTHKIQVDGKYNTVICPEKQNGEKCPFCEVAKSLRAEGDEDSKKEAQKYYARKAFVVKVIDREDEAHGPKFWRFQDNYKKTGVYDKIVALYSTYKTDISDSKTGRDLSITINKDDQDITSITAILALDPSPLSSSEQQAESWITDTRTWKDVYSVKPYDYLEILIKGGTPYWDKNTEKYVDKATMSDTYNGKEEVTRSTSVLDEELSETSMSANSITESDDLPF